MKYDENSAIDDIAPSASRTAAACVEADRKARLARAGTGAAYMAALARRTEARDHGGPEAEAEEAEAVRALLALEPPGGAWERRPLRIADEGADLSEIPEESSAARAFVLSWRTGEVHWIDRREIGAGGELSDAAARAVNLADSAADAAELARRWPDGGERAKAAARTAADLDALARRWEARGVAAREGLRSDDDAAVGLAWRTGEADGAGVAREVRERWPGAPAAAIEDAARRVSAAYLAGLRAAASGHGTALAALAGGFAARAAEAGAGDEIPWCQPLG